MAQLGQTFDPDKIEDDRGGNFDPIPVGAYEAHIIDSRLDKTKTGGQVLTLQVEVLGPTYARRQIFDGLNIVNASAQAQDIAHRTLKRICTAVGHHGQLDDSAQLHFKPMRIRVSIDPNPGYSPKNKITGYMPLTDEPRQAAAPRQASAPRQAAPQAEPAKAASAGKSRPWA